MASKETPKKVYSSHKNSIDTKSCRLCRTIGDSSHRTNIFKPGNHELLEIAERLYGHAFRRDAGLPSTVCRPCERRLKNAISFQTVITNSQQEFEESQPREVRIKRCLEISPSLQRPSKVISVSAVVKDTSKSKTIRKRSLDFCSTDDGEELSTAIRELRVEVS